MILLLACADLPPGWENAQPVEGFEQGACEDTGAAVVTATIAGSQLAVDVAPVPARCDQALAGWWRYAAGDDLDLLLQPEEMDPPTVARCDCAYAIHAVLPTTGNVVAVYVRGDHDGDDMPRLFGADDVE